MKSFRTTSKILFPVILLTSIILFAISASWFSPYSYDETILSCKNTPPCFRFWFGSDELGRDLWVRTALGTGISLCIGIAGACIDVCIGAVYGAFAALRGGKTEEILMRAADILHSIPHLLLVILITVVFGSGMVSLLTALTVTGWIKMARIIRSKALVLAKTDFVAASRLMGGSSFHIIKRHLLPNCTQAVLVTLLFTIPQVIFTEAFLSFLGLGIKAPVASLGSMIHDGLPAVALYPWRLLIPTGFLCSLLLGFHLIGERMSDTLQREEL